ncbi:hypothetical protein LUZ62_078665 [Rhynchospora pubera]|uniref:Uncharacterized protein n=1 Tax=Rhynchospora pubera TaxID=906938 RepID=A0AAV8DH32_9POAL|nr:hypothetical protein LUZ62_084278 [Rhynchospora pubera]KAJ4768290.1 hypothetical protein LUZ62_078665 [Rhynchospora pubera]
MEKNHGGGGDCAKQTSEDSTACNKAPRTWFLTAAGFCVSLPLALKFNSRIPQLLIIPTAIVLDHMMGIWLCEREHAKCAKSRMMLQEMHKIVAEELAKSAGAKSED